MDTKYRKILVVDDDRVVRQFLSKILTENGYHVVCASDGAEALDQLEVNPFDFVITDWLMPNMNGIDFCRSLRQRELPGYVYVILLTSKSQTDDIVKGLGAGADDFISKPVESDVLMAQLRAGSRILHLERRLRQMARHDKLTGVLNRGTLFEKLVQEWCRSHRYDYPLSCIMVDVDHFKRVNDTHGHMAGDQILRAFARTLKDHLRTTDDLGRYGGEEFCMILPQTAQAHAVEVAERCLSAITQTEFRIKDQTLDITASFGVAERGPDTANPDQLIDLADQALLVAKREGRNRVQAAPTEAEVELTV